VRFQIDSVGFHAPPRVQTAAELAPLIGVDEDWILQRTRVRERRICEEPSERMGARAAREALGDGPPPDLILNCSLTPTQLIPDTSIFVQRELGTTGIPSFSIHATCLSFLVGMHTAGALLNAGAYERILMVSAEQSSVSRDFSHPESAALFGDGAAAAVLVPTPEGGTGELLAYRMTTLPEYADLAEFQGAGTRHHPNHPETAEHHNLFRMKGPAIYKRAVLTVARQLKQTLAAAKLTPQEVDWVVPHQASGPALATIPRFGFREDRIVDIVETYGNCIAASVPMALHSLVRSGRLERGHTVLMLGTGAGLSVASAILRY
jgi:3-oxoacyl-[acyl-carrier-protein] synthase-3